MKKIITILALSVFVALAGSCKKDKNDGKDVVDTVSQDKFNEENFFMSIDQTKVRQINSIIDGFVSNVEMAAVLKKEHIPYSKNYLLPTSIIDNYETNIKKAIGLGLLSADLGYMNIYNKTSQMIPYLVAINNLATDLRVAQFFDFQALKTLVTESSNLDSLLFLSVSSFHQIDNYFTQTNRSYLTVLSVTGVWIESFYMLTQVAKQYPDKNFKERVGSQKELLYRLYEILKVYKGHPQFDYLIGEFKKLRDAYDGVTIKVVKGEKKVIYDNGNKIIIPDDQTEIDIPDTVFNNIVKVTEEVRNAVVNIK